MSTEEVSGKKVAGEPQGGHFTGINHQVSYLQYGPRFRWRELANTATLDNIRLAKSYVRGHIWHIENPEYFVTPYNTLELKFEEAKF